MKNIDWQALGNMAYAMALDWGVKLIGAVAILVIGLFIVKVLTGMFKTILEKSKVESTVVGFLTGVVRSILQIVIWLMVLGNLGVKTTSFIAILGSAGLAIGLALQGSLSNLGAGVLLIILRPFKVGDFISGAGQAGVIKEIGIFNTIMTTTDNKVIIIPNSKLAGDCITNFSTMETRRVDFVFGVSYADDLKLVKQTLLEIVTSDVRVLKEPAHLVAVSELADSSVNFTVRAWVKSADYWTFYFDTIEKVKITFDEKGICIPFPQRDVHIHDMNKSVA
jgi:small conductance mechanosensitive channel